MLSWGKGIHLAHSMSGRNISCRTSLPETFLWGQRSKRPNGNLLRAEQFLTKMTSAFGTLKVYICKTKLKTTDWTFDRAKIASTNTWSWQNAQRKKLHLGLYSNLGLMVGLEKNEGVSVSGYVLGYVLTLDRICDVFDGDGHKAGVIKTFPGGGDPSEETNSLLKEEYEIWQSREERRMYDGRSELSEVAAEAAENGVGGQKRKADECVLTTTHYRVQKFAFEDGFLDGKPVGILDSYEAKRKELEKDEDLKATVEGWFEMKDALDRIMNDSKYFALAFAMCKDQGYLKMVYDMQGHFCDCLQNYTATQLAELGNEKMPAA